MHIDDQTYQRNGKTYRRALLRNSYRKNGKVVHDTIANLSMCNRHYEAHRPEAQRIPKEDSQQEG